MIKKSFAAAGMLLFIAAGAAFAEGSRDGAYLGDNFTINAQIYDGATDRPLSNLDLPVYMFFYPDDQNADTLQCFKGSISKGLLNIVFASPPVMPKWNLATDYAVYYPSAGIRSVYPGDAAGCIASLDLLNGGMLRYCTFSDANEDEALTGRVIYSYVDRDVSVKLADSTVENGVMTRFDFDMVEKKGWNFEIETFTRTSAKEVIIARRNWRPDERFRWYYYSPEYLGQR